jgi:hypothetical protein
VKYELSSYISENDLLHTHRRKNLKSYTPEEFETNCNEPHLRVPIFNRDSKSATPEYKPEALLIGGRFLSDPFRPPLHHHPLSGRWYDTYRTQL